MDWVLIAAALALSVVGAMLVWSATRTRELASGGDPSAFLKRHVLNLLIGLAFAAVAGCIDYRALRRYTPWIYLGSTLGLLAVLGVGSTINGAHSWIVLPAGFQIQPSEFAKVALVLVMAMLVSGRRDAVRRGEPPRASTEVPLMLVLAAIPMGLIMLQPDLGTVLVFVFTILGALAVSGASWRWIVGLIAAGVVIAYAAVALHVLKNYQLDRFRAFTHPTQTSQDAGYNVAQARIAIGSGGWTGEGLFHGTQTNGSFVPEQQTDFIFSVAGEELGLAGAGAIIVLFGIVLWRAMRIAGRSPDMFGRMIAAGVACWFAFQVFVNIGMTLGLMPVTGLPLPFVSYGGSSMFADWIAVGLLVNVHIRTETAGPRRAPELPAGAPRC